MGFVSVLIRGQAEVISTFCKSCSFLLNYLTQNLQLLVYIIVYFWTKLYHYVEIIVVRAYNLLHVFEEPIYIDVLLKRKSLTVLYDFFFF